MKRCAVCLFLVVLSTLGLPGFGRADDRLPVFVSVLPQKFFVEQVGGERVKVQVMVRPGASPHTYEPRPGQMAALSKARMYFAVGVGFEKAWLKKIAAANPAMKVVHTDRAIEKIPMAGHHHPDEKEGHRGEGRQGSEEADHRHGDSGLDPHVWLSPPLVKVMAAEILAALKEIDPGNAGAYEANYRDFAARIDSLDADLKQLFAGRQGLRFMVFHPAWGYFAQAYGLEQVPIEIEGKEPKPARLKELIAHARADGIRVVFVQPQFSTKSADLVAGEIGGEVVFADPLAEAWLDNQREVAARFGAALK